MTDAFTKQALIGVALASVAATGAMAQTSATGTVVTFPKTPEYVSIVQDITVAKPPEVVWKKVGGYCDIATWFGATCVYTVGTGGIGTNRLIAGHINEVLVAKTASSYTYAQLLNPNAYHGTVEIAPAPGGSKIIYSLFYDDSLLPDQAAKDKDKASRAAMFMGVLRKMKSIAEAP